MCVSQTFQSNIYLQHIHQPDKYGITYELLPLFHMQYRQYPPVHFLHEPSKFGFPVLSVNDNTPYNEQPQGHNTYQLKFFIPWCFHPRA